MPAAEQIPTLERLVNAYHGAVVSEFPHGDTHEGAGHDHWAAAGAVMWKRVAERQKEEFSALYFYGAKATRLDDYIESHFPTKSRITATRGAGTARLSRPTNAGGSGTIWAGTRIAVGQPGSNPLRYYLVRQDTPVSSLATSVQISIDADDTGPGKRIHVKAGERAALRIEDPLWDPTWGVTELECADGTLREEDGPCRARITAELFEERFGYESLIIKRMKEAGADLVVLFRSDYLGAAKDYGLNRIYVGDSNFESPAALLRACRLALPSCVMAGSAAQALPVTTRVVEVSVDLKFWSLPENFDTETAVANTRAAVVEYFNRLDNPFVWDLAGLRGAIQRSVEDTQEINLATSWGPPAPAGMFSVSPLPRYVTTANRVNVGLL